MAELPLTALVGQLMPALDQAFPTDLVDVLARFLRGQRWRYRGRADAGGLRPGPARLRAPGRAGDVRAAGAGRGQRPRPGVPVAGGRPGARGRRDDDGARAGQPALRAARRAARAHARRAGRRDGRGAAPGRHRGGVRDLRRQPLHGHVRAGPPAEAARAGRGDAVEPAAGPRLRRPALRGGRPADAGVRRGRRLLRLQRRVRGALHLGHRRDGARHRREPARLADGVRAAQRPPAPAPRWPTRSRRRTTRCTSSSTATPAISARSSS